MNANTLWRGPIWSGVDLSNENKWRLIRQYLDELLKRSDWSQLSDSGLTLAQKIEWQEYRLALQELYTPEGDPDAVAAQYSYIN